MTAETPRTDERATLTEAEREGFRRNLRQNLGHRAFVIEDTMVGHVERIVTARLAAAVARAESAEAKVAAAETLRDELIALPKEPGDSVFAQGYVAGSNEAGYFLRAALTSAPTEEADRG